MVQPVTIGFFDHPKTLAESVHVFNFNSFAPKSFVLPFLLFGQFPVFRFFVRNLTPRMNFRYSQIPQITFDLDFWMDFQGGILENTDV